MGIWAFFLAHDLHQIFSSPCANMIFHCIIIFSWILMVDFYFVGFSFEQSPRHDKYVPRFEAELSQFCEKLVGYKFTSLHAHTPPPPQILQYFQLSMYFLIMLRVLLQVTDLDRRVRRGRERLAQEVEPTPPPPLSAEKSEQLSVVEEKIKNLLEQVETLGEAGKVDEAEALMRKVLLVMP